MLIESAYKKIENHANKKCLHMIKVSLSTKTKVIFKPNQFFISGTQLFGDETNESVKGIAYKKTAKSHVFY